MTLDPLIVATALEAVLTAGDIQRAHYGTHFRVGKKGSIDLVTPVDLEVERMFRALVASRFPDHDVLAEELAADSRQAESSWCWIFDPIDGTTNFAHGLPIFCASLGLEYHGQLVYGAVYDPNRRELFTAERGGGAFLNGRRLHVSSAPAVIDAMLCTGFPYDVHQSRDELVSLFGEFVGRARAVRRLGSAAIDLCYVAAGRLDGFWEKRLKPWDTSAGALIVEEAGGRVTRWSGATFDPRCDDLVASNGVIHAEMLAVIREHGERRSGKETR